MFEVEKADIPVLITQPLVLNSYDFRYLRIKNTTIEKRKKLVSPNTLNTKSGDTIVEGIINSMHVHIPNAHVREKSFDDPLFLIFNINGMLNRGRTILATTPVI